MVNVLGEILNVIQNYLIFLVQLMLDSKMHKFNSDKICDLILALYVNRKRDKMLILLGSFYCINKFT